MIICNCSEPGKIQKENVTDVFTHELFSFEFYLADTPTSKTPVFEVGSELL